MRVGGRVILSLGILPLTSCAVVGPVVDSGMENAPYEACARFAAAPVEATPAQGAVAEGAALQCLTVTIRPAGGQWQPFTGTFSAGDELLAMPTGGPQCNHGHFTHFVLTGSSDSGAMRVAVPDAFGRGDRGRSFTWRAPRERWSADNIGTAMHLPAGARVYLTEGQARLSSACFKSYTRYQIPPAAGEGAAAEGHSEEH